MILIQQVRPQESQIIYQLQQQSFHYAWPQADWIQLLAVQGTIGKIAYQKEKPIGYLVVRYADTTADIISLAVLPSYRRQGVAKRLINDMMNCLSLCGVGKILLEVGYHNKAARKLYEDLGFKAISIRPNYYYHPPHPAEDAIVMEYIFG